jgi:hypothetical protein
MSYERKGVLKMLKSVVSSAIVLVFMSSVALATLPDVLPGFKMQHQDFAIGSINLVGLVGAGGQAHGMNTATIIQNQHDMKLCSSACQDELVLFVQKGCVVGTCGGLWDVTQEALVAGDQLQLVGDGCGPKMEAQGVGILLGQMVTKVDGSGVANGDQTLAVVQNQGTANSAGMMNQSNVVLAGQLGSVSGGPCTTGQSIGTLTIGTTQTQVDL